MATTSAERLATGPEGTTMTRTTRWLRWRRRLLIVGTGLLVLEIGIRLWPEGERKPLVNYGYPPAIWLEDSVLGHRLKPGFEGTFTRHEGFAITLDEHGHRGSLGTGDKNRWLHVLGDGIAFGKYVRDEELFTIGLAQLLDEVTVVNHAVPFYSLAHQERLLDQLLQKPITGFVLLTLNPGDLEPFHTHGEVVRALGASAPGVTELPEDDPQRTLDRPRPLPFPLCYSALAGQLGKLLARIEAWRDPRALDPHARYIEVQLRRCASASAETRARAIERMAGKLQERGLGLAVVFFPHEFDLMGEDGRADQAKRPRVLLLEAARRAQVPALDLTSTFLHEEEPLALLRRPDVMHPSARGHRVAARAIAEFLGELVR